MGVTARHGIQGFRELSRIGLDNLCRQPAIHIFNRQLP